MVIFFIAKAVIETLEKELDFKLRMGKLDNFNEQVNLKI